MEDKSMLPKWFTMLDHDQQLRIIQLGRHVISFFDDGNGFQITANPTETMSGNTTPKKGSPRVSENFMNGNSVAERTPVTHEMSCQTEANDEPPPMILTHLENIEKTLRKEFNSLTDRVAMIPTKETYSIIPATKGKQGEQKAIKDIGNYLWGSKIIDCSSTQGRGDFILNYQSIDIMVEVKTYENNIPKKEWTKFVRDVKNSHCFAAFFITNGDVLVNNTRGMHMDIIDTKPVIIVPDYNEDKIKMAANIITSLHDSGFFALEGNVKKINALLDNSNIWFKNLDLNISELVDIKFKVTKLIDLFRNTVSEMTDQFTDLKSNKKRKVSE